MRQDLKQEPGKKFFFASEDADYYDSTIVLTVPLYNLIHDTVIELLTGFLMRETLKEDKSQVVLDVGAGTGKESISLMLNTNDTAVLAVDICESMEEIFEDNFKERIRGGNLDRFSYVVEDFLNLKVTDDRVKDFLTSHGQSKGCSVAMSAYCIHHFQLEEKRDVYQKMYDFLRPDGLLVNVDLFNYKTLWLSDMAHHRDIDFIKTQFDKPNPEFKEASEIPFDVRNELKDKWVDHMENDNILHSVEVQLDMLKEIGFVDVECIFKYWQQGIIIGRKPLSA